MLQKIIIALAILAIGFNAGKWLSETKEPEVVKIEQVKTTARATKTDAITNSGPFSYKQAVKRVSPAVVNIHTKTVIQQRRSYFDDPVFDLLFGRNFKLPSRKRTHTNLGSGVIVTNKGHILTNNHVIKGADSIEVGLSDGRTTTARLIGADADTDLALLKINLGDLNPISFTNSDKVEVGDVTLAIGNPFGVGQTVTMGIVSATGRSELGIANFENFIQTDAAINPGNSGGALTNAKGELIGINIAIFSKSGASHGIGFAIPANSAKNVLEKIIKTGKVSRGWLGVETQNFTEKLAHSFHVTKNTGVIVSGVYAGSPAKVAGISPGDILTHLNGKHIASSSVWKNTMANLNPGDIVQIEIIRQAKKYRLELKIGKRPQNLK